MEAIEPAYGATTLLLIAAGAVALLLFLIIRVKLHAFVALVLVSLLTALAAGIPVAAAAVGGLPWMLEAGKNQKDNKGEADMLAAATILQDYLDNA